MLLRNRILDVAWVLATNLFVLAGVLLWGWPAGNVFLLFWAENVILGVVTVVRILSATGTPRQPVGSNSIERWPPIGQAVFFTVHYGVFAMVHGGFVLAIAVMAGVEPGFWLYGFPVLLIALRYVTDLATRWFLGGQRHTVSPGRAFAWPYPRLVILHFATLIGFGYVMSSRFGDESGWGRVLDPVRAFFDSLGLTLNDGAVLVALLMILKTVVEVAISLTRSRPGKPATAPQWEFTTG